MLCVCSVGAWSWPQRDRRFVKILPALSISLVMQTLLLLKTYIVLGDYGRVRTHAQPTQRLVVLGFLPRPSFQPQFVSA